MKEAKYSIAIRSWVPRKLPHDITQEDLNLSIQSHQPLRPYVYAGWRSLKIDGKRGVRFCVGHGESRVLAKTAFKEEMPSERGFIVLPQNEI